MGVGGIASASGLYYVDYQTQARILKDEWDLVQRSGGGVQQDARRRAIISGNTAPQAERLTSQRIDKRADTVDGERIGLGNARLSSYCERPATMSSICFAETAGL